MTNTTNRMATLEDQKSAVFDLLKQNAARLIDRGLRPDAIADAHLSISLALGLAIVTPAALAAMLRAIADDLEEGPQHGCAGEA